MNKRLLLAGALLSAMFAVAQESAPAGGGGDDSNPLNKKGREILPKDGDIGIGFNTIPVLDMFLGTLNRATPFAGSGNVVQYTQASNNQLVGKYFLDRQTAIRVRFGVNTLSGSMTNQVQDAKAMGAARLGTQDDMTAASLLRVDDQLTFRKSNWMITAGYEKRRGYRRLQGFYGGEIGFGNTAASQKITYGNAFSDQYDVNFTNNFNSFGQSTQTPLTTRITRDLEVRHRGGFRFGVRGFVGIEYFVLSKISISAEYGWAYSITTRRTQTSTREVYQNGQNGPTVFKEEVDQDTREVLRGFSVDNNNGSIFSMNNTLSGNTALNGGAGALTLHFYF